MGLLQIGGDEKSNTNKVPTIICGGGVGIGDDVMFFWAVVAGVILGFLPRGIRIFFSRATSRDFLGLIGQQYFSNYVRILTEDPSNEEGCIHARSMVGKHGNFSEMNIKACLRKNLRGREKLTIYCNAHIHKFLSEFGNNFKLSWKAKLTKAIHLWRVWSPPYPNIYDGWQEVALACDFKKEDAISIADNLSQAWPKIRMLLRVDNVATEDLLVQYPFLLFPSGNGSHDFDESMIDSIRAVFPSLSVACFAGDLRSSDIRYSSLKEAATLMRKAKVVITNDSMASHLAQFFSLKHILICSRSRPENVCFPGAKNSFIIDLGNALPCRPCTYISIDSERLCAAGYKRCVAFLKKDLLKERLRSFPAHSRGS